MAHPGDAPASAPVIGNWLDPDSRDRGLLEDYELGGLALSDPSAGLLFQVWKLTYIDDDQDPAYGDFIVTPERVGQPTTIINVPDVRNCGFAFDQNMRPAICYETGAGAFYYWYDSFIPGYVTTQLPAGSYSPRMALDDKRALQDQTSDIILGYLQGTTLYYRQQRDRFDTPRVWASGVSGPLNRIGMMDNNRFMYDVGASDGVTLCRIVGELCDAVNVTEYDVSELCAIKVRGYMISSLRSSAEAIRGLQRVYSFDMPEIDGELVALLRGRDVLETITLDEVCWSEDVLVETAREQEVEFPRKLHLSFACAETDYTPTKQTSERLSPDIRVVSELNIETMVNLEPAEAAQRAGVLHKSAWAEFEGRVDYALPEKFARLVPGAVISQEIRPGVFKRIRLETVDQANGVLDIKAKYDRQSAWALEPGAITSTPADGDTPVSSLPGDTVWEFLDLPALSPELDTLHYLVEGYGTGGGWTGFQLQREIGGEYQPEANVYRSSTLGTLDEALAAASADVPDTVNTILVTTNRDLESVSDERLLEGANSAVVGDEILQFRDVVAEGNAWRLSYLLRGRLDTTPASVAIGERFVFLGNPTEVNAGQSALDTGTFNLRAPSFGQQPSAATPRSVTWTGESQREWAPVNLAATPGGGDWAFSWTPRYRLGTSANPIKSAYHYGWRVRITKGGTVRDYDVLDPLDPTYTLTAAQQTADFGGALSTPFDVDVMGLNQFTGEGRQLSETIT